MDALIERRREKHLRNLDGERAVLAHLRKAFARKGYYIAPIAPKYRRRESDFAALPKDDPHQMVVVRQTGHGSVVVRVHSMRPHGIEAIVDDAKLRSSVSVKWGSGSASVLRGKKATSWSSYISAPALRELSRLGCKDE